MRALTGDIPFGPFEGTIIDVYVGGKSKTARIHIDLACVPSAEHTTMPLNPETVNRMCKQRARSARWARRDTALGMFLQAITSMPDYSTDNLEHDFPSEERARAAELLQVGEYPPDDDEEDLWDEFRQARDLRDSLHESWGYARRYARDAHCVVAAYPWLTSWAKPIMSAVGAEAEWLRAAIARTIDPGRLVAGAAALSLIEPEMSGDQPEFSVLGDSRRVVETMKECWRRWRDAAAEGLSPGDMASSAEYVVESAIGRKRNGRDAAMSAAKTLVDGWTNQAKAAANIDAAVILRDVVVRLPERRGADTDPWKMLTQWELAAVAQHATAFSWAHDAVLLKVPGLIAQHLLAHSGGLRAAELDSINPLEAFTLWVAEHVPTSLGVLPGTLDDTPISERRTLTSNDIDQLRRSGGAVYQVFSASDGTEVLHISTIARRCANGWRGVIVAGPDDLPATIIKPWMDEIERGLNDEAHPLSTRAGEQSVVELTHNGNRDAMERRLRTLALVRTVADLRTLTERYEHSDRDIDWRGVLTAHPLDLTPFKPPNHFGGLDLPLGVLSSVQIYTTDGKAQYQGKGHSPFCSFARSGRTSLDDRFDLLHMQDLLDTEKPDWCSVCGGYAARRLDDTQLRYYLAAHELSTLGRELTTHPRFSRSSRPPTELKSSLEKLNDIDPDDCDLPCKASTQWRSTVERLLNAHALNNH
ncbi:hypothetical protein [Alloactinosynnema sp. L-07]|uniref:hypothetical protein n=1 Tax=Alloactinosynnema sp. L-07 TaxID=1653480 RepID=UPI00065EFE7B|nr:hypothetical protein [Alloactinosynnema sp. L-07]CRK56847.1 hypothetical protein [Alloactinosynnema sp. L-07]